MVKKDPITKAAEVQELKAEIQELRTELRRLPDSNAEKRFTPTKKTVDADNEVQISREVQ